MGNTIGTLNNPEGEKGSIENSGFNPPDHYKKQIIKRMRTDEAQKEGPHKEERPHKRRRRAMQEYVSVSEFNAKVAALNCLNTQYLMASFRPMKNGKEIAEFLANLYKTETHPDREDNIVAIIKCFLDTLEFDAFMLQEVSDSMCQLLMTALEGRMYSVQNDKNNYSAVVWSRNCNCIKNMPLKVGEGRYFPAVELAVGTNTVGTKVLISLVSIHFHHTLKDDQKIAFLDLSLAQLLADDFSPYTICGGDMNTTPERLKSFMSEETSFSICTIDKEFPPTSLDLQAKDACGNRAPIPGVVDFFVISTNISSTKSMDIIHEFRQTSLSVRAKKEEFAIPWHDTIKKVDIEKKKFDTSKLPLSDHESVWAIFSICPLSRYIVNAQFLTSLCDAYGNTFPFYTFSNNVNESSTP